jgi:hypothetical protein
MERPTRLDELVATLGRPKKVKTAVEPNPHVKGAELEWRHLEFDAGLGVSVVLLDRDPNRILVSAASITSAARQLPGGLHIGDPKSAFRSALGAPQSEEEKQLVWHCNDADFITAVLDADRVRELRWLYYVD